MAALLDQSIKTGPTQLSAAAEDAHAAGSGIGLSGKLLVLTLLFVLLAEVFIYVPSMVNFWRNRLNDHLAAARIAALVLDAAPEGTVPKALEQRILTQVGAFTITLKRGNARHLLAFSEMPPLVNDTYDLREAPGLANIEDAFGTLLSSQERMIRIIGDAAGEGDFVEIVISDVTLRANMWKYSLNILLLSLFISAITAFLVYVSLLALFVKPMREMSAKIMAFREAPEAADTVMAASARRDEIGVAERELRHMQLQIQSALSQKAHLAALGLAVSKISHDLRNILASAQLFSDRLSSVAEPTVQRLVPRVIDSVDRAIALCQSTLAYGKAVEPQPMPRSFKLKTMADDVGAALGLGEGSPRWMNEVARDFLVYADSEQLYRALLNLVRNAVEAVTHSPPAGGGVISISARRDNGSSVIEIRDNGPGLPEAVRKRLFQPFSSSRLRGTGLGLTIVAELIRGHGGKIALKESGQGTVFEIRLPCPGTVG